MPLFLKVAPVLCSTSCRRRQLPCWRAEQPLASSLSETLALLQLCLNYNHPFTLIFLLLLVLGQTYDKGFNSKCLFGSLNIIYAYIYFLFSFENCCFLFLLEPDWESMSQEYPAV